MAIGAEKEAHEVEPSLSKGAASATESGSKGLRDKVRSTAGFGAQSALLKPAAPAPKKDSTGWSEVIRRNFKRLDKSGDGFISRSEANASLSDPSFTGADAAAVSALLQFLDLLEELSNDEFGDENDGLTLTDLAAYEKGTLQQKMKGDLTSVEGTQRGGESRIAGARRELFPNGGPSLTALRQGAIGDCYFLAAMGAFISRDPAALTRMIRENRQGKKVAGYTVTFPGKLGTVTVPPPTDGEIARYSSSGQDGLWLVVMEKAYAVARSKEATPDIHAEIGEGGQLSTGLSAFTAAGMDSDLLAVTRTVTTFRKLDAAFGRGQGKDAGKKRLVTAAIMSGNDYGLPKGHAYSVLGWDGTDLVVRNPWGFLPAPGAGGSRLKGPPGQDAYATGIFLMSLDEFDKVFSEITYEE